MIYSLIMEDIVEDNQEVACLVSRNLAEQVRNHRQYHHHLCQSAPSLVAIEIVLVGLLVVGIVQEGKLEEHRVEDTGLEGMLEELLVKDTARNPLVGDKLEEAHHDALQ